MVSYKSKTKTVDNNTTTLPTLTTLSDTNVAPFYKFA